MSQRVDNTMIEFLQKLLKNIAEAKLLPDADMAFLVQLENEILNRAKQPVNDMRDAGILPPAGGPPAMPPSFAGGGAPTRGGVMGSPDMSGASTELGRMMAPSQGPQ